MWCPENRWTTGVHIKAATVPFWTGLTNCRSLAGGGHSIRKRYVSMLYQTLNPFTEEVVKTFPEHTDAQLQQILAKAEAVYESDWSQRSLAERKKIVKKAAAILRDKLDEF